MLLLVRDNSDAPDPGLVQDVVSQLTLQQYCEFATVALLFYDAVITLDKEIEFFWGTSLKHPVNLIYFLNRYTGIFAAISRIFVSGKNVNSSTYSNWAFNIPSWITIISLDYILILRVLALYSHPKLLSMCLMTFLGLEAVAKFGFGFYTTWIQHISSIQVAENISACGGSLPNLMVEIIDWSVPMVYGLVLMLLALYKAAEYWRVSAGLKGFRLVQILIRDQMLYFLLAVSCCVLNIMEFKVTPNNANLAVLLEQAGNPSFLCVLGSRLFFNMKEAGKLGVNEGTNYRIKSLSNIEFEHSGPAGNEDNTGNLTTAEDV